MICITKCLKTQFKSTRNSITSLTPFTERLHLKSTNLLTPKYNLYRRLSVLILTFVLFNGFLSFGQNAHSSASSNTLIPRANFFQGTQHLDIKLNPNGTAFYYRKTNRSNVIYFKDLIPLKGDETKIDSIVYPGKVQQYVVSSAGLICVWKGADDMPHFSMGITEMKTRFTPTSIKILPHPVYNFLVPVEIKTKDGKADGLYVFYTKSEVFRFNQDALPAKQIFFDDEFNPIAGNDVNKSLGASLLCLKDSHRTSIVETPWGADMMLGGFSKVISASLDGKTIYYTSNKTTDKTRLYSYDTETKKSIELAASQKCDLLPFGASINHKGHVTSIVGLYAKTIRISLVQSVQEDFDLLKSKLKCDVGFVQSVNEDKTWLIRTFTGGPMRSYAFNRLTKKLTLLITDCPQLDKEQLATRHAYEVTTKDNLKLPIHVYLPPGTDTNHDGVPDKPLPTIVYVHGGPWVGVVHWNQYWHWRNFQLLANRGYAVINCEFRGGTGLGKSMVEKSIQTWGTDMTQDIVDITDWSVKQGIAQSEKVGIWGWSYGGYAAVAGPAFSPKTYACGVSMFGIADLEAFGDIPFADDPFWKQMLGDPTNKKDRATLADQSPINFVKKIQCPILFTTGSKDARVPKSQVDNMVAAMKKAKKEPVYFYYPNEVHDYVKKESWISFWAITEHFLKQQLGGRAQPIGTDKDQGDLIMVEGEGLIK